MALTTAQRTTLKAAIVADGALNALPNTPDDNQVIADAFNAAAVPDFWVWKTSVSESEYTSQASVDGTNWSWTSYIGRSQGERDGWGRMFATGSVNPSRPNVQTAIGDIFSGAGGLAQRTHLIAVSRRKASRAEKMYATGGNGAAATPATLTFEGTLTYSDVEAARNS